MWPLGYLAPWVVSSIMASSLCSAQCTVYYAVHSAQFTMQCTVHSWELQPSSLYVLAGRYVPGAISSQYTRYLYYTMYSRVTCLLSCLYVSEHLFFLSWLSLFYSLQTSVLLLIAGCTLHSPFLEEHRYLIVFYFPNSTTQTKASLQWVDRPCFNQQSKA